MCTCCSFQELKLSLHHFTDEEVQVGIPRGTKCWKDKFNYAIRKYLLSLGVVRSIGPTNRPSICKRLHQIRAYRFRILADSHLLFFLADV